MENKLVQGRTYGKPKEIEVNPGVYDIKIQALVLNGLHDNVIIEGNTVEPGRTKDVHHEFVTGIANLGVSENGTLVDCTVSVYDKKTDTSIAGGRSYTAPSSNPRKYILNPGTYKVRLRGRKNGVDTIKWFEITVEAGKEFTKMYEW